MSRLGLIKCAVVAGWVLAGFLLAAPGSLSKADAPRDDPAQTGASSSKSDEYVGGDTCAACHEVEAKSFSQTTHSRLEKAGWKDTVTGCESCHGPGKAHVELMGETLGNGTEPQTFADTTIHSFKKETAKQISDTCLACHAGKEEHNNFRRGEHWRNDIGCTYCHSPTPLHTRNSNRGATGLRRFSPSAPSRRTPATSPRVTC